MSLWADASRGAAVKVLVTDHAEYPHLEQAIIEGEGLDFQFGVRGGVDPTVRALIVWHRNVNNELVAQFPNLQVVQRYGVGYDNVDLQELEKRRIAFANNPSYGTSEVADHALGLLFTGLRGISEYSASLTSAGAEAWQRPLHRLKRLSESTLGVVGAGRIGSRVARQAQLLGLRVVIYDPYVDTEALGLSGCSQAESLLKLLSQVDAVSVHVPLTRKTKDLISTQELAALGATGILVNTSRGGVVNDEQAMKALRRGSLAFYGTDVLSVEPPDTGGKYWSRCSDLIRAGKLVVTPHVAYYSSTSYAFMRTFAAQNVLSFLKGESFQHRVPDSQAV